MSLTSLLRRNKDVRDRFGKEFFKPKFSIKREILAPPLSKRSSLVGTAFDYLFRFYLQRLNPNTICKGYWVAENAVEYLAHSPTLHKKGKKIIKEAKKNVAEFLNDGQINDELIKSALLLGGLDPIFRAGVGHDKIGLVHKEEIQDLRKLFDLVEPHIFKVRKICLVNPTFGEASSLVGGADADFVIDDTLVDIKTSKDFRCLSRDFHQLMGYYTLHQIGSVGQLKPKLEIKKVGFYFPRFAYLHTFEIKEIIDPSTFPKFIKWFSKRARQEQGVTTERTNESQKKADRSPSSNYIKWSNNKGESLYRHNHSGIYFIISSRGSRSGSYQINETKAMLWLEKSVIVDRQAIQSYRQSTDKRARKGSR